MTEPAPSSVSTPAQDATALAFIDARLKDLAEANSLYGKDQRLNTPDKIARNDREISWLKDLRSMIRATSQTPDAVRDNLERYEDVWNYAVDAAIRAVTRDGYRGAAACLEDIKKAPLAENHPDKFVRTLSTPSASAGPLAEAVEKLIERSDKYFSSDSMSYEYPSEILRDMTKCLRSTPSASAGPQADADHIGEYIADYSPLTAEEIAQEDPELTALYARSHPQPKQADGLGAVAWRWRTLPQFSEDAADQEWSLTHSEPNFINPHHHEVERLGVIRALQQSPATDGPGK